MNRVVHFEIHASDKERIKKFYESVFGWEMHPMGADMGSYIVIMTGKGTPQKPDPTDGPGINGGITTRSGELPRPGQSPNAYVCIVDVDNIDEYIQKAKNAGGTVALDKMDVPTVGKLVYFLDPENNLFGMIEPEPMPKAN